MIKFLILFLGTFFATTDVLGTPSIQNVVSALNKSNQVSNKKTLQVKENNNIGNTINKKASTETKTTKISSQSRIPIVPINKKINISANLPTQVSCNSCNNLGDLPERVTQEENKSNDFDERITALEQNNGFVLDLENLDEGNLVSDVSLSDQDAKISVRKSYTTIPVKQANVYTNTTVPVWIEMD